MYNYLTTETEEEHAERVGADEESVERVWCDACQGFSYGTTECLREEHAAKVAELAAKAETLAIATRPPRVERVKVMCSCGYSTCPLTWKYGLPVPMYRQEIRPLPTQPIRDMRAVELKAGL